jgi:hypothetical protein
LYQGTTNRAPGTPRHHARTATRRVRETAVARTPELGLTGFRFGGPRWMF